ncbi:MAG: hypothetical protein Q8J96_14385 [Rhodocyclaceae bacterium]|nr:hypothetical protein [Rhodocyclaceae bacterium]
MVDLKGDQWLPLYSPMPHSHPPSAQADELLLSIWQFSGGCLPLPIGVSIAADGEMDELRSQNE